VKNQLLRVIFGELIMKERELQAGLRFLFAFEPHLGRGVKFNRETIEGLEDG